MKFLSMKVMECELGNQNVTLRRIEIPIIAVPQKDKQDFANKIRTHVNNHICKNTYRSNRGCMELTGGYLEETIQLMLLQVGNVLSRANFCRQNLNDAPWSYGGIIFEMPLVLKLND